MYIPEGKEKIKKKFFVFQIIVFELGVANSHNLLTILTGYLPSGVNQTNTTKTSSNTSVDILHINFADNDEKHDKGALMEIS